MAMFLSRLKQILNLGTKSITANGTYSASGDGYDGYTQVSVNMPSVAPSNSTPAALTSGNAVTPSANGYAISTYYALTPVSTPQSVETGDVVKFSGDGYIVDSNPTTISITPSNTNPARMTANTLVKPTANGYAIASYDSITPSSICEPFFSGDIVKFDGNGVVTDAPPIDITPSNSSPAAIPSNIPVKATTAGIAIESIDDVIYPNYNPQAVSADSIVKIGAYNGYVIDDYDDITPSSTPVSASSINVHINGNSATIVDYINDLTPTNIPENVSAGDNIHFEGSGVIVDSITDITPSNASPAQMTAYTPVNPIVNGYAIESYLDVYPDNDDPVQIASDGVAVFKGAGIVIEDAPITAIPNDNNPPELDEDRIYIIRNNTGYLYETQPVAPTSLTPSNSSPATITSGGTYTATANGKAVASITDVTPTTTDGPETMTANNIYRPTVNSYAINEYTQVQSSDSNPPILSPGHMYRIPAVAGTGGYLYKTQQKKIKTGTFTIRNSTSAITTVDCGFQPKYIAYYGGTSVMCIYNSDVSTTKWIRGASSGIQSVNVGGGYNMGLQSVTSTGFTVRGSSSSITAYYFAIG